MFSDLVNNTVKLLIKWKSWKLFTLNFPHEVSVVSSATPRQYFKIKKRNIETIAALFVQIMYIHEFWMQNLLKNYKMRERRIYVVLKVQLNPL